MLWTILQTIGSLLSGGSILTAFILYRKEKNDSYIREVRQSIADMRTVLSEQCSLLENSYMFSYAEEYFSNRYVQHYLHDLGMYIENNLDKSLDEIKAYCKESKAWDLMLEFPILRQNVTQGQYFANNAKITKGITYSLADIKGLARMLELFQDEAHELDNSIENGIKGIDFGLDAICNVLVENRAYINNENILRRKLIQKYISVSKSSYADHLKKLKAMHEVIEIVLEKIFSLDNKALLKYASQSRKQSFTPHEKLQDNYIEIINHLPDDLFSDCKMICSRIVGSIDNLS